MRHTSLGALVAMTLGAQSSVGYAGDPKMLVVGFSAGGTSSIAAQHIAEALRASTGFATVVKNVPGAGGRIAADEVARSSTGEEFLVMSSTSVPLVPPSPALVPIGIVATYDFVAVVKRDVPQTLDEYMQAVPSNDALRNVATAGAGSVAHLISAQLFKQRRLNVVHIPRKSSSEAILSVLTGEAKMAIVPMPDYRASTDLQILARTGVGIEIGGWIGIYAPPGTSPEEAARLSELFRSASGHSVGELAKVGLERQQGSGEELRRRHRADYDRLKPIADELGITSR